jgi:diguanylate cyclase (GGDEF)-like protein
VDQFLNFPTILVFNASATFLSSLVFAYIWFRGRQSPILAILAMAAVLASAGAICFNLRAVVPLWLSSGVGLFLVSSAAGLFWQAFAVFDGKRPRYCPAVFGAALWLLVFCLPLGDHAQTVRAIAFAVVMGTYSLLAAYQVSKGNSQEPLPSRHLASGILLCRALIWYSILPLSAFLGQPYPDGNGIAGWLVAITLINTLLVILALVSLLTLAKERGERTYKMMSERDPLTGLANRRLFLGRAEAMLKDRKRQGALLLLDIDHFKAINDANGHAAGDSVLIALAKSLESLMQDGWLTARVGGEEFACLLPGADTAAAHAIARDICLRVERLEPTYGGQSLSITVSIGVAATDELVDGDVNALLTAADAALYQAKDLGRNRVQAFHPAGISKIA